MFEVELVLSKICRDFTVEVHEVIKILFCIQFLYNIVYFSIFIINNSVLFM